MNLPAWSFSEDNERTTNFNKEREVKLYFLIWNYLKRNNQDPKHWLLFSDKQRKKEEENNKKHQKKAYCSYQTFVFLGV